MAATSSERNATTAVARKPAFRTVVPFEDCVLAPVGQCNWPHALSGDGLHSIVEVTCATQLAEVVEVLFADDVLLWQGPYPLETMLGRTVCVPAVVSCENGVDTLLAAALRVHIPPPSLGI